MRSTMDLNKISSKQKYVMNIIFQRELLQSFRKIFCPQQKNEIFKNITDNKLLQFEYKVSVWNCLYDKVLFQPNRDNRRRVFLFLLKKWWFLMNLETLPRSTDKRFWWFCTSFHSSCKLHTLLPFLFQFWGTYLNTGILSGTSFKANNIYANKINVKKMHLASHWLTEIGRARYSEVMNIVA